MRNKNGPQIRIDGSMMMPVPTDINVEQAFGNFEELARGTSVAGVEDRMRLLGALCTLGDLHGFVPKVGVREALGIFEQIAVAYQGTRHTHMALAKSIDLLEDGVEAEEARLEGVAAATKSDEGTVLQGGSPTISPAAAPAGPKAVPSPEEDDSALD